MLYSPPRSHNTQKHCRKLMPHPFLLPHRQIDDHPDEFTCDQKLWELPWADDFRLLHEDGPLSIAVCRLYIDGVDTGGKSRKKAKKVLVFLWSPLGAGSSVASRRVITVMLGDRCCQSCGCSGRCTVQAIWKVISWSFAALRNGINPDRGPFREPLTGVWASRAGQPLRQKGVIGHIGGDWEAFADHVGARRWNHSKAPCVWCNTDQAHMHDYSANTALLTREDWATAKIESTVTARLTPALARDITSALAPDFRKDGGSKGLALTSNVGVWAKIRASHLKALHLHLLKSTTSWFLFDMFWSCRLFCCWFC